MHLPDQVLGAVLIYVPPKPQLEQYLQLGSPFD